MSWPPRVCKAVHDKWWQKLYPEIVTKANHKHNQPTKLQEKSRAPSQASETNDLANQFYTTTNHYETQALVSERQNAFVYHDMWVKKPVRGTQIATPETRTLNKDTHADEVLYFCKDRGLTTRC